MTFVHSPFWNQVLNMRSWTWSKAEVQSGTEGMTTPCAGHSLVSVDSNWYICHMRVLCQPWRLLLHIYFINSLIDYLSQHDMLLFSFIRYLGTGSFFQQLDIPRILLKHYKVIMLHACIYNFYFCSILNFQAKGIMVSEKAAKRLIFSLNALLFFLLQ